MSPGIAQAIDHAVLQPTQTDADTEAACRMGSDVGVATICVKPHAVPLAARLLCNSPVGVSTVIGFPHGGAATEVKVHEAHVACAAGATELDMVVNLGKVLGADWYAVEQDIRGVVEAGRAHGAITKVIFETGLLPDDSVKVRLCQICARVEAAFVKTSTGFGYVKLPHGGMMATGATEHDVRLMRAHLPPHIGIKASGGIRDYAAARRMIQLGATRLGTSATRTIVEQERAVEMEHGSGAVRQSNS